MVKAIEEEDDLEDEDEVKHHDQHKPNFVKHLNKTRTMSAKQKWEWAFDKILTVSNACILVIYGSANVPTMVVLMIFTIIAH